MSNYYPDTLKSQVGGSHYIKYKVQPLEFAERYNLSPIIFCIFKYLVRYKDKNGIEDLNKALHCVDVFVECGNESMLCLNTQHLADFLEQFPKNQAQAIFSVLQLQADKTKGEEVKTKINTLKEAL